MVSLFLKKTIAKFIQITEKLNLFDIWRIRNPKIKCFTFRQRHTTLATFSTDHSPILFSLCQINEFHCGKGLWKFNKSLIKNENYLEEMKKKIKSVLNDLNQNNIENPQFCWEYLKYEIRKFSIHFSKNLARNLKKERIS